MIILEWLGRQRRRVILEMAVCLVLVVGYLDLITGPEFAFTVFYVAPVVLAAWYVSGRFGAVMCGLCAVAWFTADALGAPHSQPLVPYWNDLVLLAFLLTVSSVTSALRAASQRLCYLPPPDNGVRSAANAMTQEQRHGRRQKQEARVHGRADEADSQRARVDRLGAEQAGGGSSNRM